jgi:hypothetical protein
MKNFEESRALSQLFSASARIKLPATCYKSSRGFIVTLLARLAPHQNIVRQRSVRNFTSRKEKSKNSWLMFPPHVSVDEVNNEQDLTK